SLYLPLSLSFFFFFSRSPHHLDLHSFPTRRSSDLSRPSCSPSVSASSSRFAIRSATRGSSRSSDSPPDFSEARWCTRSWSIVRRSEEHTSELQSRGHLVCRLLLEKKKKKKTQTNNV